MNPSTLLDSLGLPAGARVDQRVPKKLLVEHGAPTASDRRQINEGIEELRWVAALKPTTIGVRAHQDSVREYLEIAILRLSLREGARSSRLTELVHRAVPYPVVLITEQPPGLTLSLAHKRWSQGEAGKMVLDGKVIEVGLGSGKEEGHLRAFQDALALARQPRSTMYALYQGWIDCVTALLAARISGAFALPGTAEDGAAMREGIDAYVRTQHDIAVLRTRAAREAQVNRRVELNLEIKRLETELVSVSRALGGEPSENLNHP